MFKRKKSETKILSRNLEILNHDYQSLQYEKIQRENMIEKLQKDSKKQKELIDKVTKIATGNSYNDKSIILDKIRELVNTYNNN